VECRTWSSEAHAEGGFGVVGCSGSRRKWRGLLASFENVDAEAAALIEDGQHLRALSDADGASNGSSETDVKEFAVMPWTRPGETLGGTR